MTKLTDLTGQTLGRWAVLKRATSSATGQTRWQCRCSCGTERIVFATTLKRGDASCGCAKIEQLVERSTKHGHATNGISPTYHTWAGMIARCSNPNHRSFKEYGGRGIKVCKRWQKFANFLSDMGEKPTGSSLDRFPNQNGDYKPSNCRWASDTQQARNKSNNRLITHNGRSLTAAEWSEELGVPAGTIHDRLKYGFSTENAFSIKRLSRRPNSHRNRRRTSRSHWLL